MPVFYKGVNDEITYAALVDNINATPYFYPEYKAQSYADFVFNLLVGIVNNQDIVLKDFLAPEINKSEQKIQVAIKLDSVKELIEKITFSSSKVGVYSSGSEGPPKLIYQPIQRLMQSVRIEDRYQNTSWGFTYNPVHSAGIQVLLQVLANVSTLIDLHEGRRDDLLVLMQTSSLDYISGTPTFYRMLAPFDFAISSVKSVTLNGEKSTLGLINEVKKIFPNARIRNIYGSTEAGPLMSSETDIFTVPLRLRDKLKVLDEELFFHHTIVSNSVGQLEWYPSGDLVEVLGEDPLRMRFISRKSRVINVGGHNVNPQHIEELLLEYPGIKDARVYGKENALIGQLLQAELVLIDGYEYTEVEILDKMRSQLASYKIPRIIRFIDEMKTGRTGKKLI